VVSAASLYGLQEDNELRVADYGLPVTTAARLSAAFPYVSPAPRPDWPADAVQWQPGNQRGFHVVDAVITTFTASWRSLNG